MKKRMVFSIMLILLAVVIFLLVFFNTRNFSFPDTNDCEELESRFDLVADLPLTDFCLLNRGNRDIIDGPLWIGGVLIDTSSNYIQTYNRYENYLAFRGKTKTREIIIGTLNETMPYQIGQFYKFDLRNECALIFSAASSGMFSDPDLNALSSINCS